VGSLLSAALLMCSTANMKLVTAFLLSLLVVAAVAEGDQAEQEIDITHPVRTSTRHEDPLASDLADRASLLFRSMDHDRDRKISLEDVRQSGSQLALHMPGVDEKEFLSFMELADKNGDHMLDRDELLQGIADGMTEMNVHEEEAEPSPTGLVETEAETASTRRKGFLGRMARGALRMGKRLVGGVIGGVKKVAGQAIRKVTGGVDASEDACVMCQYIVERCENNIKQSGVIPSMSGAGVFLELEQLTLNSVSGTDPAQSDSFTPFTGAPALETPTVSVEDQGEMQMESPRDVSAIALQDDSTAFVETEQKQAYFDQTAAGIIGSTRQSTRVQRQLERQKYNEIYRVVDISLDDVCEQGMPNSFYGYCKQIYKVQSDVVDGLRYQYRPADICFRVGMCGKSSYITKGIHSRYK